MNWGSYSFLYGPMLALAALAGLALVARWASTRSSLVESPPVRGSDEEYGLMIPVASPVNARASREAASRLIDAGVRCREVQTTEGRRLMVWAEDVTRAHSALDTPGR